MRAFIGVGSNIEPATNLRKALVELAREMRVTGISTVYETAAEERPEQPRYYNCVVEVETKAGPVELKRLLRQTERRLGRVRTEDKYASRTIDLDILAYDALSLKTEELTLPDPEIAERPYLAAGLAELAPDLTLPDIDGTPAEMAKRLPTHGMQALDEYTTALRREALHGS